MKGLLLKDAYQIWHYAKGVIVAAVVMMGESAPANSVIVPWNTATGRAEKMQPRPSEAVMVQTMMQSNAPFRASVDQSPSRPSWIDPTMAMAPIHTAHVCKIQIYPTFAPRCFGSAVSSLIVAEAA